MKRARLSLSLVAALAVVASASAARADDHADAEQAFREGRKLLDAGQLERACERLNASQKLESAAGTLLNLADCYERRGMIASAAATYKEAAVAAALRSRADWEQFALTRYAVLRPLVPTLTAHVAPVARVSGLVVLRDGRPIMIDADDVGESVDPGKHTISASAPGRRPWSKTVVVAPSSAQVIDVPLLVPVTEPEPAAPLSNEDSSGSWRRPTGFVVGGVGLVAVAVGAVAGIVAINGHDDARSKCSPYPSACTAEGTAASERASGWATVSTIGFVAGGALLGAGTLLVLTAPTAPSRVAIGLPGRLEISGTF